MSKVALFDMDGTLADYESHMRYYLREMEAPCERENVDFDVEKSGLHNAPDWIDARMKAIKKMPGWWKNIPKYEPGFLILQVALGIGFNCHILTKGPHKPAEGWTQKREWCHANLPDEVGCTITEDKSLVFGRVLVDDYEDYIVSWLKYRPRGLVIMPDWYYNRDFEHPQVIRFRGKDDIEVVREALKMAYARKGGDEYHFSFDAS